MLGNCPNLVRDSLYVRFAALDLQFIPGGGGGGSGLDYVILLSEGGGGLILDYG